MLEIDVVKPLTFSPTFMFEHRSQPLLPARAFAKRLLLAFWMTLAIVAVSLLVGTLGFWGTGLTKSEAFHHTCLILGGHDGGPAELNQLARGELEWWEHVYCGIFVLYARLVFVALIAIVSTPLLHRIFHRLHLDPKHLGDGKGED